jgi:hypothetical protein
MGAPQRGSLLQEKVRIQHQQSAGRRKTKAGQELIVESRIELENFDGRRPGAGKHPRRDGRHEVAQRMHFCWAN